MKNAVSKIYVAMRALPHFFRFSRDYNNSRMVIGYILIFTAILLSTSCERNDDYSIEFKLEAINQSGVELRIYGYENGILFKDFTISDEDTISYSYEGSFIGNSEDFGFQHLFGGDSVRVIFDNKKHQIFVKKYALSTMGERNFFRLTCIDDLDDRKNQMLLQYTFTEEDYQNAEFCNEECDE